METPVDALGDGTADQPPLVSVIIPAYNTAEFIGETLESVFTQTCKDFEVIIINDGSRDTAELEQAIAPFQKQLVYIRQDNKGPAGARNAGIRVARGKYIAFLDSDDCWLPDYLTSQLRALTEAPWLDAIYADARHFGDPATAGKTYMQTCPSKGPVTLESLIREDCQVITSCTVALRQAILSAGYFDERTDLRGCEDYDLWLRILCCHGQMAYQRKVLGSYRSRPGNLTSNVLKMSAALVAVYRKLETNPDLPNSARLVLERQITNAQAQFHLEAGKTFLKAGEFVRARDSLTEANRFFHRAKLKMAIGGLKYTPRCVRLAFLAWNKLLITFS